MSSRLQRIRNDIAGFVVMACKVKTVVGVALLPPIGCLCSDIH